MKKSNQTIEESLDKIKFMMNYDSSKTFIENNESIKNSISEQRESPGGIAGKTALAAGAYAGAGAVAGGIAGTVAGGTIVPGASSIGIALGAGSFATAGAIGGAVLLGAYALALAPLVPNSVFKRIFYMCSLLRCCNPLHDGIIRTRRMTFIFSIL